MKRIVLILGLCYMGTLWSQTPRIQDLWFHQNPQNKVDTGLLRMSFPTGEGAEVLVSIIGHGVDFSHPYLQSSRSSKDTSKAERSSDAGTHSAGVISSFRNHSPSLLFKNIKLSSFAVQGDEDVVAAIDESVRNRASVIFFNSSWNFTPSAQVVKAILRARSAGIFFISGSDSLQENIFPCSLEGIFCVGALDANGNSEGTSLQNARVAFFAPGVEILSASGRSEFKKVSSSASAAAIISTLVAALKSYQSKLSEDEILYRLYASSINRFPSFERIFIAPTKPLTVISLKNHHQVEMQKQLGKIDFEVKSFGTPAKVNLTFKTQSGIELVKQNEALPILPSVKKVSVSFRVKDQGIESAMSLKIRVNDLEENSYEINSRMANDVQGKMINEFTYQKSLQWGLVSGSEISYLYSFKEGEFNLYKKIGTSYKQVGRYNIPLDQTPLFVHLKMIKSEDGKSDDFFWAAKDKSNIILGLLDSSLTPRLLGYVSEKLPAIENIKFHYLPFNFEGKKIKVPVYMSFGSVSKNDVMPGDFSVVDPVKHIYWLEPKREGVSVKFNLRTITHERFREKILSSLSVGLTSLVAFKNLSQKGNDILMLAGIQDSEGIIQNGVTVELKDLDTPPKVKNIGFAKPMSEDGGLYPYHSETGAIVTSQNLFVSSPERTFYDLNNLKGPAQLSTLGMLKEKASDTEVLSARIVDNLSLVWLKSPSQVYFLKSLAPQLSYRLESNHKVSNHSSPHGIILSLEQGAAILTATSHGLISPLKWSFFSKDCRFLGVDKTDMIFACQKLDKTKILRVETN